MTDPFAKYPSLQDRTVLVTGGASGIGASIVEHFAVQGAKVGFIDLDVAAGEALVERLGGHVTFEVADLRKVEALKRAIGAIRAALGPITSLVNNAARDDRHTLGEVTSDYWDERIATNLKHQFFAAQAVAGDMKEAGGGAIVNLSSVSFMLAQAGMPVYLTAKSGVIGLTRALARELGPSHIRVNALTPGWIMTERQIKLWLTPEAEAEMMKGQCLPEKLYPADIARMALWLVADDSRLVTAQNFVVDAGWT